MTDGRDDELTLVELFHRRAGEQPAAPAVAGPFGEISYAELERRARRLAVRLRRHGVGPEVPVALALDRSPDLVVAMLATLEAGGAYLPLDPEHPAERLAFMLEDSGAPVVVAKRGAIPAAEGFSGSWVFVDEAEGGGATGLEEGTVDEMPPADPANLAYVIYTSGSTGRPKAVGLTHRGIRRLATCSELATLGPGQRVGQTVNSSFDVATLEIWAALLNGACLVLVPPAVVRDPPRMAEVLRSGSITTLFTVTALFHEVARVDPGAFGTLDAVHFGGEAADPEQLRRVLATAPPRRLVNAYGPTESTVISCWYTLRAAPPAGSRVPIGVAVEGTELLIRGPGLRPVPDGETGELLIAGEGLARAYLRRPAATAAAFVPHPSPRRPGERAYRTGDLVRRLPGGDLDFAGRRDDQVKVRGFRVELGEIEHRLIEHPAVASAVVVLRGDGGAARRLVAYVVPQGDAPEPSLLAAFLGERLPEHMVPAAFVALEALPLTPHGKVDRKALPDPGSVARPLATPYVAPRTPLETRLADLWSEILRVAPVGIHDSLFELGGHSLVATRLATRVRDELGVDLPMDKVFSQPTVAAWAAAVEAGEGGAAAAAPIVPGPRPADIPPAFAQQRVWFLQQLQPQSLAYQAQARLELHGRLEVRALSWTLDEIVRRHESLRTAFPSRRGLPVQEIHPPAPVPLPLVDLRGLPQGEREAHALRIMEGIYRRNFAMDRLPLVRWILFRLEPEEHRILHVEHHLVHDGWSFNCFLQELGALYTAALAGKPSPLAPLPLQFADFALWQQSWLESEEARLQLEYWRGQLSPPPETLRLPLDRPRPPAQGFRGKTLRWQLPAEVAEGVRGLARSHGGTVFMVLLTAFHALLHRLTGQTDLANGSGIANRRRREVEPLIGMIINTLVMRVDAAGDPSFAGLLDRVRTVTAGAYANQDLPLEKVVEVLNPERDASHNPFFQVMFSFHDAPLEAVELPGLELGMTVALPNGSAKFDLNVTVILPREQRTGAGREPGEENDGAITFLWELDADLFDEVTVRRWIGAYRRLVDAVLARPETRLSELPLLDAAQRHQVVAEWNDTAAPEPEPRLLHELVADQVRRTPEAMAVVAGGASLSYAELWRRATLLAGHLRARGIRPEEPVAIAMDRSLELVVGLLGILLAGGAYVPLDPEYPAERLALILEDTGARRVLVHAATTERMRSLAGGAELLAVDAPASADTPDTTAPGPRGDAAGLAYVIHTSGSTGRPKGAMNSHRGIVNRLRWMQRTFGLGAADRVLQKTPVSFDVSVWELFWPLITGARLVMADPGGHRDPAYLARTVEAEGITTMHFVPSMLRLFLEAEGLETACAGVVRVMASGEALEPDLVARFHQRLGAELHNLYGPTEAAVDVTHHPCPAHSTERSVAIGRPVDNTRILILDRRGDVAPVGVAGELHIGGVQLARGYWRRPGLTAERFVADGVPGSSAATGGERLYRTGDLARTRPDGEVEFLGRLDHQVKVRGFRIELGEIEAVLAEHPAVREAAVIPNADGEALIAFAVIRGGAEVDDEDLRAHLRARLPEFMVPASFERLDELPLGPSGKVDRRALARHEPSAQQGRRGEIVAPRTELEEILHTVWSELIGVAAIGVHDNFFDLGGHSLHATRHMYRVRELLDVDLPVRTLYDAPTIEAMARVIETSLLEELGELEEQDAGRRVH